MKKILLVAALSSLLLSPHSLFAHKFFPIQTGNRWWYLNEHRDSSTCYIGARMDGPHAYDLLAGDAYRHYEGYAFVTAYQSQNCPEDWCRQYTMIEVFDHTVYRDDEGYFLPSYLGIEKTWETMTHWRSLDYTQKGPNFKYTVMSIDVPCMAPMGIFLGCIAVMRQFADTYSRTNWSHIPRVIQVYAPHVGLIREMSIEKDTSLTSTKYIIKYRIDNVVADTVIAVARAARRVNLRQLPTVKSKKISVLKSEEKVTIFDFHIGPKSGKCWYHVYTSSGLDGWVYGDYLSQKENVASTVSQIVSNSLLLHPKGGERLKHKVGLKVAGQNNAKELPKSNK